MAALLDAALGMHVDLELWTDQRDVAQRAARGCLGHHERAHVACPNIRRLDRRLSRLAHAGGNAAPQREPRDARMSPGSGYAEHGRKLHESRAALARSGPRVARTASCNRCKPGRGGIRMKNLFSLEGR